VQVKEGWGPLERALGVTHPEGVDFPNVNVGSEFSNILNGITVAGFGVVAVYIYVFYRVMRKLLK
jgi:hypothetical protein